MERTMHDAPLKMRPNEIEGTRLGIPVEYQQDTKPKRPEVVCLCGSTKFKDEFEKVNRSMTLRGYIVLSVGMYGHADGIKLTDDQKAKLDELHLRKIDMADWVFVINKDGYIGQSTSNEINYSVKQGKPVMFLEDPNAKNPEKPFKDWVTDIGEFHGLSGDLRLLVAAMPAATKAEFLRFRINFMLEELNELQSATTPEAAVDAIIDMMYVGLGTLDLFGIDARKAWNAVHYANMAKTPGVNANRPNPFGFPDYIKPDGWVGPDHSNNTGVLSQVYNWTHPSGAGE